MLLGLQFSVFTQMHREPSFDVVPPLSWQRNQLLWSDLDVFEEEVCSWHYPRLQSGYNVERVTSPEVLHPDLHQPRALGFFPNGDLMVRWDIAEVLADEFDLSISAIPSSVDGRHLIIAPDIEVETLLDSPIGRGCKTGVLLERRASDARIADAKRFILDLGSTPMHLSPNPSGATYYRIDVPVFQAETRMNRYAEESWPEVDVPYQRLLGFGFQIIDNPVTRSLPLFATEHGHLIVSAPFYETLLALYRRCGQRTPPGKLLPILRTP